MNDTPLVSVVIPTYNRKNKLTRLIRSIIRSDYPKEKLDIIVVDDASNDGTSEEIAKLFPKVNMVVNENESLLAACRNIGILQAKGDLIFFIDDDNIVAFDTIKELVCALLSSEEIGVVGPIMYYYQEPNRIWCAGVKRNYLTTVTTIVSRDEIDLGQFKNPIESEDFPNAFMIRKSIMRQIGLFDEDAFPIHYDESDFCKRVRNAGYKVVMVPAAKIWHDIPIQRGDLCRALKLHTPLRTYYTARNRIIFMKRFATASKYILFIFFFLPLFGCFHFFSIFHSACSSSRKLKLFSSYMRGIFDGLFYTDFVHCSKRAQRE
jgi:GT2 family glycosyltransferase